MQPQEPSVCGVGRHVKSAPQPWHVEELVVRAVRCCWYRSPGRSRELRNFEGGRVYLIQGAAGGGLPDEEAVNRWHVKHRLRVRRGNIRRRGPRQRYRREGIGAYCVRVVIATESTDDQHPTA